MHPLIGPETMVGRKEEAFVNQKRTDPSTGCVGKMIEQQQLVDESALVIVMQLLTQPL